MTGAQDLPPATEPGPPGPETVGDATVDDATGDDDTADDATADGVLDPTALDLPGLRARRDAAVQAETGLSYLRRLVQGPLDLVRHELVARAGGAPRDVAALVADLPVVLAETGPRASGGRLPRTLVPTEVDAELAGELDHLTGGGSLLAGLPTATDDDLVVLVERLDDLERRVSARRRHLQRTIDGLNAELADRYRRGEATVEGALSAHPD